MDAARRTLTAVAAAAAIVVAVALLSTVGRSRSNLAEAVTDGNHELARILLSKGDDPDAPLVNGHTPVMRAAIRNDDAMVRLLAENGADLEAPALVGGLTPLHAAAVVDSEAAVRALIEHGADLNARSISGRNALDHAAAAGSIRSIAALAEAGIDPNARSEVFVQIPGYPADVGPTPLAIAARAGRFDAVQMLLELGANVDGRSLRGQTALLHAVASGQPAELISLLLESGADAAIRAGCVASCVQSDTDALGWALRLADPDVVTLLERHTTSA